MFFFFGKICLKDPSGGEVQIQTSTKFYKLIGESSKFVSLKKYLMSMKQMSLNSLNQFNQKVQLK
jgi:hypothetical protein